MKTIILDGVEYELSVKTKKDYEIIAYVNEHNEVIEKNIYNKIDFDNITFKDSQIRSVKILLENEIFTIGDNTVGGNKIINFKLDNGTLKILLQDGLNDDYNWWTNIESLRKKIKVPLFTKEQEEEIINIINRCQYQQTPNKSER